MPQTPPLYIIVMGVSGSGKSTVGQALAEALALPYVEADDLHPTANIHKMSAGIPLNDDDRAPWLAICADVWRTAGATAGGAVLGCSALKRAYRDRLRQDLNGDLRIVYLDGSKELIAARMAARANHFMPTTLLDSQFAALEIPSDEEGAVAIDLALTVPEMIAEAKARLTA